jgi:molecular chaperone GrpE
MKKKDVQDNGHDKNHDVNISVNVNTDENIDGNQHLNEPVAEEPELEKLKARIEELNDKYVRQAAEFDNFRRRNAKERVELMQTAGRDVITDLLDVLDDSERAQKQMETTDDVSQIKEGIQLVFSKLRNTLSAKGLKPMEVVGQEFNPDLHEAITEIDAGEEMRHKVVAEIQKGYYLNGKIIRFAKVVVGK